MRGFAVITGPPRQVWTRQNARKGQFTSRHRGLARTASDHPQPTTRLDSGPAAGKPNLRSQIDTLNARAADKEAWLELARRSGKRRSAPAIHGAIDESQPSVPVLQRNSRRQLAAEQAPPARVARLAAMARAGL
jgi:hypothetical protein